MIIFLKSIRFFFDFLVRIINEFVIVKVYISLIFLMFKLIELFKYCVNKVYFV